MGDRLGTPGVVLIRLFFFKISFFKINFCRKFGFFFCYEFECEIVSGRVRPYHGENTASRQICQVKHRPARLVLGWETAWEHRVSYSFFCFSSKSVFLKSIFTGNLDSFFVMSLSVKLSADEYDHTTVKIRHPVRSAKSSTVGLG